MYYEKDKNITQLIEKASRQLQAIESAESSLGGKLHESIVLEIAKEFKAKAEKDRYDSVNSFIHGGITLSSMQQAALDSALSSIEGKSNPNDPLIKHFASSLASLDFSGKAAAKKDGTVSEKVGFFQYIR